VDVTETPAGISAAPFRYRHIPLTGAPVSAHGRVACHPIARVCVLLDAAVTRVTCTCPARRGPARRGCHSCDVEPSTRRRKHGQDVGGCLYVLWFPAIPPHKLNVPSSQHNCFLIMCRILLSLSAEVEDVVGRKHGQDVGGCIYVLWFLRFFPISST